MASAPPTAAGMVELLPTPRARVRTITEPPLVRYSLIALGLLQMM